MSNGTDPIYLTVGILFSIVFAIAATWVQLTVVPAIKRARAYSKRMQQCGQLDAPPTEAKLAQMRKVCRFFVNNFVGEMEIDGQEKLAKMPAPFIFALNHGSLLDVAIAPLVLNRSARYPAAQGVMTAFCGLNAYLFGPWGVFSVDLDNGHAALDASVKVVSGGEIEVIFPEAWTHMDGHIGPMKTGAVRIVAEASKRLGKPVSIVPGYIRYNRYPGAWITKLPIPVQWLIPLVFACVYKRGAKIVIGDPISSADLPADPKAATEILKQKIVALKPAA